MRSQYKEEIMNIIRDVYFMLIRGATVYVDKHNMFYYCNGESDIWAKEDLLPWNQFIYKYAVDKR